MATERWEWGREGDQSHCIRVNAHCSQDEASYVTSVYRAAETLGFLYDISNNDNSRY